MPPTKKSSTKPSSKPPAGDFEVHTGQLKAEINLGSGMNYLQKLPLEVGKSSTGDLVIDLRMGFSMLLALPGDIVVRVSVEPVEGRLKQPPPPPAKRAQAQKDLADRLLDDL